jgi:UTP--glucose-1-phosphate uridylyltransferase
MDKVRDALLVAAGIGTRMFPVSASVPKESLPLVDVPLLTHLLLEAKQAGIERLHIITSPSKSFDSLLDDRRHLHVHRADLDEDLFHATDGLEVLIHVQKEPKGVGNAMEAALHAVDGPFLVMLGDNLLMDEHASTEAYVPSKVSKRLIDAYHRFSQPTVGLMEVDAASVSHYGIVGMDGDRIVSMVEKPTIDQAPSRLAMCGRYVFPADMKTLLQTCSYEQFGDLQSIEVLKRYIDGNQLHGLVLDETQWYDSGAPLMWLKAQVDHALRRPDVQDEFRTWLTNRFGR